MSPNIDKVVLGMKNCPREYKSGKSSEKKSARRSFRRIMRQFTHKGDYEKSIKPRFTDWDLW